MHFRIERSPFLTRSEKYGGARKFSIIFAPGNESSRERKLAGAKVPRLFALGRERSLSSFKSTIFNKFELSWVLGTVAPRSESTQERNGPFPLQPSFPSVDFSLPGTKVQRNEKSDIRRRRRIWYQSVRKAKRPIRYYNDRISAHFILLIAIAIPTRRNGETFLGSPNLAKVDIFINNQKYLFSENMCILWLGPCESSFLLFEVRILNRVIYLSVNDFCRK